MIIILFPLILFQVQLFTSADTCMHNEKCVHRKSLGAGADWANNGIPLS